MNINEKQRLWSKYYLTHDKDNILSILDFLNKESEVFGLYKQNIQDKKRKIFKYMLKSLNKKMIFKNYFKQKPKYKNKTKNELIDLLLRYIY